MKGMRALHGEAPILSQFGPSELRLWGLFAAGYRDEEVAQRVGGVTVPALRNSLTRLYSKTGANLQVDVMQPRVVLALMYWRAMGKLREDEEICNCPHVHTGSKMNGYHHAVMNGHTRNGTG